MNVDIMTCSFCLWTADGHRPDAVNLWEDHMASAHPVYWAQRNAAVGAIANTGTYDTGFGDGPTEACGRLAQMILAALGLTPDVTGEGTS